MHFIQKSDITLEKVVSIQKLADGTRYRLLTYCLDVPVSNGHILYNSLTCESVYLDNQEYASIYTNDYLINHWFLVPERFDDKKFKSEALQIFQLLKSNDSHLFNFTIFTTTDCNARCFYCFQKGRPHNFMTLSVAEKIANYIISEYNTHLRSIGKKVLLQWFGGEPLYNHKIITYICQKLKDHQVDYYSSMISNGYLFTSDLAKEAHDLWHLKTVQITLDGTETVYNRVKNYIYKDENAFQRVMSNIDSLLSEGINVPIRLNIDSYNSSNLMELAKELGERFQGKKGFSCYAHALFEQEDKEFTQRTDEQRTLVFDELKKLQAILDDCKISRKSRLRKEPRLHFCKSDSDNAITILPDGNIGLCDYYTDNEYISHIDNPEKKDQAIIDSFKVHCDDLSICDDCPIYPQCIRLKKCGEEPYCFTQLKEYRVDRVKEAMLATYNKWLKKQDVNPDYEDGLDDTEQ